MHKNTALLSTATRPRFRTLDVAERRGVDVDFVATPGQFLGLMLQNHLPASDARGVEVGEEADAHGAGYPGSHRSLDV